MFGNVTALEGLRVAGKCRDTCSRHAAHWLGVLTPPEPRLLNPVKLMLLFERLRIRLLRGYHPYLTQCIYE